MMLAKVTTKSTLPVMKCLHTGLLYTLGALAKQLGCVEKASPPANLAIHTTFAYT
jgi:hypothetical protein